MDLCFVPGDNKIAFKDNSSSGHGKSIVGTVVGTAITFGSAVTFYSGGNAIDLKIEYNVEDDRLMVIYLAAALPGTLQSCVSSIAAILLRGLHQTIFLSV